MGVDILRVLSVNSALESVGPKKPDVAKFIKKDSFHKGPLWLKQPYRHEYALAYMYFGLEERGESLSPEDQAHMSVVFEWLNSLDNKSFPKQEWIRDRKGPMFLNANEKGIIQEHLEHLKQKDFIYHPEYIENLINSLSYFTRSLAVEKILSSEFDIFHFSR